MQLSFFLFKVILSFSASNAGLGNQDAYRSADSVSDDGGRVTLCPLRLTGPNNESHLLLHCRKLREVWKCIKVSGGVSLEESLSALRMNPGPSSDNEAVRCFLGQSDQSPLGNGGTWPSPRHFIG